MFLIRRSILVTLSKYKFNFSEFWKKAENSNFFYTEEKLQLPYPTVKAAANGLSSLLGFEPLNELDKLDVNVKKYEILFATMSYYETMVFLRLQVVCQNSQCLARVMIRSEEEEVNEMLVNNIYKN
jgi:hypothetical protein